MNFIINHKTGYAKGLFTNEYFRHESFLPLPNINFKTSIMGSFFIILLIVFIVFAAIGAMDQKKQIS